MCMFVIRQTKAYEVRMSGWSSDVCSSDLPLPERGAAERSFVKRHPYMLAALAVIAVTGLLGLAAPALQSYPPAAQFTTGAFWEGLVQAINVNFFDQLEALKTFMLLTQIGRPSSRERVCQYG